MNAKRVQKTLVRSGKRFGRFTTDTALYTTHSAVSGLTLGVTIGGITAGFRLGVRLVTRA